MTIELLFFLSLFGSAYSYFLYPILLIILPKKNNDNRSAYDVESTELPSITFIITAFNEEKHIDQKLLNTLEADYPTNKKEILVASDGSTDDTNNIVTRYKDQNITLIDVPDRKGKENAQFHAIAKASGEILVFSDVTTRIEPNALHVIANAFINEKIGAVSSEDRFLSDDGSIAGEGAYVKYEMWLRKLESQVNSLIGLSGSFFAARKSVCLKWDITIPSDFNTALNCIDEKLVAITEPNLLGFYPNIKDETKEYSRKLRTVIRGMAALYRKAHILNPLKYGLFSIQLFSHKLMRWLVPWFMLSTLVLNILLLNQHILYVVILLLQFIFYAIVLTGYYSPTLRNINLIKIPYFFMQVNIAIAHASILFIMGKRITKWTPSKR